MNLKGHEDTHKALSGGSETHGLQMQILFSPKVLFSIKIMGELSLQEILCQDQVRHTITSYIE